MALKLPPSDLPLVVIFGRTNVGKSTLFNRLTEKKQALISDIPGTTRDANYGPVNWQNKSFTLVDTGGFLDTAFLLNKKQSAVTIDEQVQKQARQLITKAEVILFVVDTKEGLMAADKNIARIIKKILPDRSRLILVANKADGHRDQAAVNEFWPLGLGEPQAVSAATGMGTGDLLDLITDKIAKTEEQPMPDEVAEPVADINVCLLGQPNVGKSSLLNAILGYERVIVSEQAHTTREPQDTLVIHGTERYNFIDTAGINKKWRDAGYLIKQGIAKTLEILDRADLAILVVDSSQDLNKQDARLVEEIFDRKKSLIIVANKWDMVDKHDTKSYSQNIYRTLPFAQFAPIIFLSAKNKTKVKQLLKLISDIAANRRLVIGDKELEKFIKNCVAKHKPTKGKGARKPRLYYFTQTGTNPPEFMARIGSQENLAESYLGFIVNQLRAKYNLIGTPVKIWVKK